MIKNFGILLTIIIGSLSFKAFGADYGIFAPEERPVLVAQSDGSTDVFDPFLDYSEYDTGTDEEADINFFRNGRFVTIGFLLGDRTFTQGMRNIMQDTIAYGMFLSYFFDLRFALQLSFQTGDHPIRFSSGGKNVNGSSSITDIGFNLKYYFNTQNVTRGLASLNPYVLGGFSQVSRTSTVSNVTGFSKDSAMGANFGGGIEIPMRRNQMFIGAEAAYHLVTFQDESHEIVINKTQHTGLYPDGDIITLLVVLGINF